MKFICASKLKFSQNYHWLCLIYLRFFYVLPHLINYRYFTLGGLLGGSLYEKPNSKSWNFKRPYSKSGQKTFKAENLLGRKYVRTMHAGGPSVVPLIFFVRPKKNFWPFGGQKSFFWVLIFGLVFQPFQFFDHMILAFCKEPSVNLSFR